MGYYINPPNGETLRYFTAGKGYKQASTLVWDEIRSDLVAICVVDNITFKAAAICYSRDELIYFQQPDLFPRPVTWYLVSKKNVAWACPEYSELLAVAA
jgi:hypothetical protein